jgi:uncharacterized protein
MAGGRMLPRVTDFNRAFWTGGREGKLLIQRCTACGRWAHPPQRSCAACGGTVVAEAASGDATVYTFTVNHHPFNPTVPVPYVVALVELAEQEDLRMPTNIVDCDPRAVRIGMPVHVAFEDEGDVWVPVFRPSSPR